MEVRRRLALVAWVLAVLASQGSEAFRVHHKLLILTKPGYLIDATTAVLDSYGVPYDVLRVNAMTAGQLTDNYTYVKADGSASYSGIFMQPDIEGDGTLNRAQVTALWAYAKKYSIRMVKTNVWPANHGMNIGTTKGSLDCTSIAQSARFTDAATSMGAFDVAGLNPAVNLPLSGIWRCPAASESGWCGIWASDFADTGLGGPCTTTPLVETDPIPGTSNTNDVSTTWLATMQDGREVMATTHDCSAWSPACLALGHFQLSWVLRGLVPGYRRAMLNTQVDDLFLVTEYGPDVPDPPQFRVSPDDLFKHVKWFQDISTQLMPAGSDYRAELCFNGNGVLSYVRSDALVDIDNLDCASEPPYKANGCNCYQTDYNANTCKSTVPFCQQCIKNWPKPPGMGTSQLTRTFDEYVNGDDSGDNGGWDLAEFMDDPLFEAIRNNDGNVAEAFFWNHHTFTHQNFDNVTASDAAMQLRLNQHMASKAFLGLEGRPGWSNFTIVTPQISGLANADMFKGLSSVGISAVTGDNSWAYLRPDKPHSLFYTTMASANYDGYPVIPRFATETYFNATDPEQNLLLYNNIYGAQLGMTESWDDVLDREANRVLQSALLQVRHDPHMFHQANLNTDTGSTGAFGQPASLLMLWVERIVAEHKSYTNWPLLSVKADDLYNIYKAREARDACNFDYTLNINAKSGSVQNVLINAKGSCAVPAPFMAPADAKVAFVTGTSTVEQLGDEAPTYWGSPSSGAAITGVTWAKAAPATATV